MIGEIVHWEYERGYGFIESQTTQGTETFFCHIKEQLWPHHQWGIVTYHPSKQAPAIGQSILFIPEDNGMKRRNATGWTTLQMEDSIRSEQAKILEKEKKVAAALEQRRVRARIGREQIKHESLKHKEQNLKTAQQVILLCQMLKQ